MITVPIRWTLTIFRFRNGTFTRIHKEKAIEGRGTRHAAGRTRTHAGTHGHARARPTRTTPPRPPKPKTVQRARTATVHGSIRYGDWRSRERAERSSHLSPLLALALALACCLPGRARWCCSSTGKLVSGIKLSIWMLLAIISREFWPAVVSATMDTASTDRNSSSVVSESMMDTPTPRSMSDREAPPPPPAPLRAAPPPRSAPPNLTCAASVAASSADWWRTRLLPPPARAVPIWTIVAVFRTVKHPRDDAIPKSRGKLPMPASEVSRSADLTQAILQKRGAQALNKDDAAGERAEVRVGYSFMEDDSEPVAQTPLTQRRPVIIEGGVASAAS